MRVLPTRAVLHRATDGGQGTQGIAAAGCPRYQKIQKKGAPTRYHDATRQNVTTIYHLCYNRNVTIA